MPQMRSRIVLVSCLLLLFVLLAPAAIGLAQESKTFVPLVTHSNGTPPPKPSTDHPRLWVRASDLPRLRSWAVESNPLYAQALATVAQAAKGEMDSGLVPNDDCGTSEYEEYPVEMYAEFFAFMSLVDPNAAARADYAQRARTLLMHVMNEAVKGPTNTQDYFCEAGGFTTFPPYRDPEFYTSDSNRARWHGEAYPLVVDWIYPILSTQDKATIRQVFLRWAEEIVTEAYHHPEPVNMINDPSLIADRAQVRWSGNNYYVAHMRNLGLLAMALDPADDQGGALGSYLEKAIGAWLYIFDDLLRTDSRGGLLPEGFEYSPQTSSYAIQFLLALHTAGEDDATKWGGNHVDLRENPFWEDILTAYLHSLSPATTNLDEAPEIGPIYQPAWYGDAQEYRLADFIDAFGPLGIYRAITGDVAEAQRLRWTERHTAPGGEAQLFERAGNPNDLRHTIFYFMLMDPTAAPAPDPRPAMATHWYAGGLNRLFARTDWTADAAWFVYTLSWNFIDHQQADGNHFEFYRNGEWLTKARIGYANIAEGIASTEFRNALTLENDKPDRPDDDWRVDLWRRGSQWSLGPDGDPTLLAYSVSDEYAYALGDATNLYNWTDEGSDDIVHASRSILWLKPDHIVLYDRGQSATANRFKRVWFQLPSPAQVSGQSATMTTTAGQQLFVTALLPGDAVLTAVNDVEQIITDTVAGGEPMKFRLMTEAPGGPQSVRFLHVVQGADGGASPDATTLLESTAGTPYAGVALLDKAVLFPVDVPTEAFPFTTVTYRAPVAATRHFVTGLLPNARYDVVTTVVGGEVEVVIQSGIALTADSGGVLAFDVTGG